MTEPVFPEDNHPHKAMNARQIREERAREAARAGKGMPIEEARLRPHLRVAQRVAAKKPKPKPLDNGKRVDNPRALLGIGITGRNPSHIARTLAGAQLTEPRQTEPERSQNSKARRRHTIRAGQQIDAVEILIRHKNRCYLCGVQINLRSMHQEHIIPIVRGGTHTAENVAAACRRCNSTKGSRFVAFRVASRQPVYFA
jgi:5-methylcytosine-specific restriction endonuclease McrA